MILTDIFQFLNSERSGTQIVVYPVSRDAKRRKYSFLHPLTSLKVHLMCVMWVCYTIFFLSPSCLSVPCCALNVTNLEVFLLVFSEWAPILLEIEVLMLSRM